MKNNTNDKHPSIFPAQHSIAEPSADVEGRMVSKDQLENFLKDTWDELNQITWWDHIDRILIFVISTSIPILFEWGLDTFSAEQIKTESFAQLRFIIPALCVVLGLFFLLLLRSIRKNMNMGTKKKQFIDKGLQRFPMNSKASIPYSNFKPINPSDGE